MKNDVILPLTRAIAGVVVLFLVTAFGILFFLPDQTGTLFAWSIKPHMSSMFFGSAYLGGAWILAQAAFGKNWHRVQAVFPAVTVFTIAMLIATLLHWERFSLGTIPFIAWLILYIVSPFLIPALWMYNRRTDTYQPETSDVVVSITARLVTRFIGTLVLLCVTIGFFYPTLFINIWPWTLTPLTARVRRIQRDMTRRRMLAAVKTATVVVTNPTHFAVALEYKRGAMSAPRVVAKGQDLLAARIREIAREHGVPEFCASICKGGSL